MISFVYVILLSVSIMRLAPTFLIASSDPTLSKSKTLSTEVSSISEDYRLFEIYKESDGIAVGREKLDALAMQLHVELNSDAWLMSYAGKRACVGEAKKRADAIKDYLVRKGLKAQRVKVVDAGFLEEWAVELWVVIRARTGPLPRPTVKPEEVQIINRHRKGSPRCPKAN